MNLDTLIEGLGARVVRGDSSRVRVCDVDEDSRTVVPGTLFIARRGLKSDGRAFVPQALAAGAVAVLTDDPSGVDAPCVVEAPDVPRAAAIVAERFHSRPSSALGLCGITGTNGKTTTAFLVHSLLNGAGIRCGLMGTVLIDDGREVAESTLTTPPALEISRTLATMVESGCRACAMEVSSHSLVQSRVAALDFRVGVFTNLTGDHLDFHGTMERYADAKAMLFERLGAAGVAVVNADDPAHARMLEGCAARAWRCSIAGATHAECRGVIRSLTDRGTGVRLDGPWGTIEVETQLVGRHNVMNALQACASAHALGVGAHALASGLSEAAAPPGRLEPVVGTPDDPIVLVDYAHTDDALEKAIDATRAILRSGAALWVVFGCGGDRDRTKRPRMGATAARRADRVVVTSDNPRTEAPARIIEEILAGVPREHADRVHAIEDRSEAIAHAIAHARSGDIVLIAGKGHETCQILPDGRGGTLTRRFDDRECAREALSIRAASRGAR